MELVVARNPKAILIVMMGENGEKAKTSREDALKTLRKDRRWHTVSAVKNGRVYLLDDDDITLPGPRLFNGLEQAARALHPNLFGTGASR
jgi:iron complex transport system substrate-binding protein